MPDIYSTGSSSASTVGASANAGELSAQHPCYINKAPDWTVMRDVYAGQRAVKEKGFCYLPPTSGMCEDGVYEDSVHSKGGKAYRAYLTRALFHNFVTEAIDTAMGMLWNKPPKFELPEALEFLKEKASISGGGLEQLLRSINRQQLITGRLGLLSDLPAKTGTGQPHPYIAMYCAEKIVNWDAGFRGENPVETTNMVVLDESGPRRLSTFQWENVKQYRVLFLGDPDKNETVGTYRFGVFSSGADNIAPSFRKEDLIEASYRGKPFDHIPWTFVNAKSTEAEPCDPPLLGLADLCLALYRLEADYRQALFMQTQDTLFTKGFPDSEEKPLRTGAGARIHSPLKDGDAKYVGVNSAGLPEMREAITNDIKRAASKAGEMMDSSSRARESGDALEMRIGSKTATLNEIAISGAEGLQRAIRDVAQWMGLSDSEIEKILVKPNFEFASAAFNALDFKAIIESKLLGGPMSWESIHEWSSKRGGPGALISFDDVMAQIEAEVPFADLLGPQITPTDQAGLDLQETAQDDQRAANEEKAKADLIAAKKPNPKPAPAGGGAK